MIELLCPYEDLNSINNVNIFFYKSTFCLWKLLTINYECGPRNSQEGGEAVLEDNLFTSAYLCSLQVSYVNNGLT